MSSLLPTLLASLPDAPILDARIGLHWTAVVVDIDGEPRCGLASTLHAAGEHGKEPDVPQAGRLEGCSALELARLALSSQPTRCSLGIAAINALLPRQPHLWSEANAEDMIALAGGGKHVVLVGHFPFAHSLRERVGSLTILELNPGEGDLPAEAAPEVIPSAQVVAITAMTLANHTLEGLLALCSPQAHVILLGPSTPLSPLLFDFGIHVLSGSVVEAIDPVMRVISQGGNFRQAHRAGVRLVNIVKSQAS